MIKYYFDLVIQFAHMHSILFVFIVITSLLSVFIITVLLLNPKNHPVMAQKIKSSPIKNDHFINTQDIRAIAGDDVMVTQLDLARAYIELDKHTLAKQILENVVQHGSHQQQLTAQQLIAKL